MIDLNKTEMPNIETDETRIRKNTINKPSIALFAVCLFLVFLNMWTLASIKADKFYVEHIKNINALEENAYEQRAKLNELKKSLEVIKEEKSIEPIDNYFLQKFGRSIANQKNKQVENDLQDVEKIRNRISVHADEKEYMDKRISNLQLGMLDSKIKQEQAIKMMTDNLVKSVDKVNESQNVIKLSNENNDEDILNNIIKLKEELKNQKSKLISVYKETN